MAKLWKTTVCMGDYLKIKKIHDKAKKNDFHSCNVTEKTQIHGKMVKNQSLHGWSREKQENPW